MNLSKISQAELNLSVVADKIVTNAGLVSYHLFCPFCADFYLFEFTLKDHLKREHSSLIQKHFKNVCTSDSQMNSSNCDESLRIRFLNEFNHVCDLCGAMFMRDGLISKHIINYHGSNCYAVWRTQQPKSGKKMSSSIENICKKDGNDSKEMYAKYSPGLSEMFEGISTRDYDDFTIDRTPLKSILKKSASKSARIISSPSSSSIRRIKNSTSAKRSTSARRVLRFDIANTSPIDLENVPFGNITDHTKTSKKSVGQFVRRILFGQCAGVSKTKKSSNRYTVTCTPANLLEDAF
ncbi:uncharacterized protein LOC116352217 [Contarinia nasturtii]|uniref:uncharacterized protein LOC116352217 n=1 Tax=Contarinia nasturtii TaxID=265458 RepID=UPI0012D40282|nr:uncharacterized protein LOC116352217 [Contarinia nasturtii]